MKISSVLGLGMIGLASAWIGCSGGADSPGPGDLSALGSARIIDLTYAYDENTLYWPNSPSRFELTELAHGHVGDDETGFFYSANSFCMPEHGGTHLDAPIHFWEGAWSSHEIPVTQFVGPATVIDVSSQAEADPDYRLTAEDVRAWESEHGEIPAGAVVLLRTGWGKRWPDAKAYLGDDTPGDASNLHFPSYGEDAAEILVNQRKVHALGVDTGSIDYGPSTHFEVHQIASAANVIGLENVANLEELPAVGAWVVALPVKIVGGSGGPVRIVAFLPN